MTDRTLYKAASSNVRLLRLDKNGVPILSRADLEERAEAFLRFFDPACLEEPFCTPLAEISTRLMEVHGVKFVFGRDLGASPEGYRYRGRFHIPSSSIFIDQSLPYGEARFNFTLAHEIAHFVLHRKLNPAVLAPSRTPEISDTNRHLLLDQIAGDNPRTWIEWQANKFASSLLLPRGTVPKAVQAKQLELGVTRNFGLIFLDSQPGHRRDYREVMAHLELVYQTSKAAIRLRLRELNILTDRTSSERNLSQSGPERSGQILFRLLQSLEEKWNK